MIYIGVFQASSMLKSPLCLQLHSPQSPVITNSCKNALSNSTVWRSHVQKFASLLERIFSTSIFKIFTIGLNGAFLIFFAVQTYNTPGMTTLWLMPTLSIVYVFFCLAIVFEQRRNLKNVSPTFLKFSIYFMIFLGILSGHGVRDSYESHVIFYSIFGALTSYLLVSRYQYRPKLNLSLLRSRFRFLFKKSYLTQ